MTAEICLLAGTVRTLVDGRQAEFVTPIDRWLLVALVCAGDSGVSFQKIREATGLNRDSGALRQRVSRIVNDSGLPIASIRGVGYRLPLDGIRVDAVEFVALVERAQAQPAAGRPAVLRRARDLWGGGLPVFPDRPSPGPRFYYSVNRAGDLIRAGGRSLLVVDDKIGDALAARLRLHDHRCEVAHSYEEYQIYESRLTDFDLVLLDRHLTSDNPPDRLGDRIAESINRRGDGVPVMMMTAVPPHYYDLDEWCSQLGLAGAIVKAADGSAADLGTIVLRVHDVLVEGPVERTCRALEAGMVGLRRQAEKRLRSRYGGTDLEGRLERMHKAAAEVQARAMRDNLRGARQARDEFLGEWASPY